MMSTANNSDNEVDIYGDLPLIPNQDEEVNKLQDSKKKLEDEVRELKAHLEELTKKNNELESKYQTLGKNISSLFRTAAAEIERKDRMISELRKEQDNLVFRRNRSGGSGANKTQPNSDSKPTDYSYSRNRAYGDEQQPELQSSERNYRERIDKNLESANDVCQSSEQQHKEYTPDYSQPDEHYLELDYEDSLESYSKDDHANYLEHEHNRYINESTLKSQNDFPPMTLFSQRQKQRAVLKLKEELSKSSETDNETQCFKQSAELAPLSDTSSNTAKNSIIINKTGDPHATNSLSKENEIQAHKIQTLDGSLSDSNLRNEFRKPENRPTEHMSAVDNQFHEVHVNLLDDKQPECSSFEESRENSSQNSRCFSPSKPHKTIKTAELSRPSSYVPDPLKWKQYKIPKRIREASVSRALRNLRNRSRSRSLMRSPPKHGFMAKRNKSYDRLSPSKCSKYSSRSNYHGKTRDSHSPDTSDRNNRFKKYDSHMRHPSPHSARYSSRSMHKRRERDYGSFHHNSKRMDRNAAPYPLKSRSSNNFTRSELKFCDSKMKDFGFSQNKLRENDRQKAKFSDNVMTSKSKESYRNSEERDHDSFYKRKGYGKDLPHNVISSHARRDSEELDRNSQETDHNTSYKIKGRTKNPSHIVKNSSTRYESKEEDRNSKEVDIDSNHKRKDSNKKKSHKLETRSSDRSESTESDRNSKDRDHHSSIKTKGTNKDQPDNVISSCARIESKDSVRNSKERDQDSYDKIKGRNKDLRNSNIRSDYKDLEPNLKEIEYNSSCKTEDSNQNTSYNLETKSSNNRARSAAIESDRNSKEQDDDKSHNTKGSNEDPSHNIKNGTTISESKELDKSTGEDHCSSKKTKRSSDTKHNLETNVADNDISSECKELNKTSKEGDIDSSHNTNGSVKCLSHDLKTSSTRSEIKELDRDSTEMDHDSSHKANDNSKNTSLNLESKSSDNCVRHDSDRNSKEKEHNSSQSHKDPLYNMKHYCAKTESKESKGNSKERDKDSSSTAGENNNDPSHNIETKISENFTRNESKELDRISKKINYDLSHKTNESNTDSLHNVEASGPRSESKESERNSREGDLNSSYKMVSDSKTKSLNNISIRESIVSKRYSSERNYFEDQAKKCDKDSLHNFKSDSVAQEVSEGNSKEEESEPSCNLTEETSTVFSSLQLKSNSSHKTSVAQEVSEGNSKEEESEPSCNLTEEKSTVFSSLQLKSNSSHKTSVAQEVSEGNSKQEESEPSCNLTEETSTVLSSLQLKSNSSHETVGNNDHLKNVNDNSSCSKVKESKDLSHNKQAKLPDNVAQSKLKLCDSKQYPDDKICKENKFAVESVLTVQPKPKVPTAEHENLPSSELSESHPQEGYDSETFYYNALFYKPEEEPINWHLKVIDVDSSKFVSRTKILDMIKKNAPHDKASSVRAESKSELSATEISNSTGLASGGKDSEQVLTDKTNENSLSDTSFKTSTPQAISPNLNASNLVLSDVSLSEHCEFRRRKKCRIKQFSCDGKEIVQSINKPRTNILHISTNDNRGFKRQLSNEEITVQPVAKRQALDKVAPTESTNIKKNDCSIEKMERNLSPCVQKDDELSKRKLKEAETTGSNETYSNKYQGRNDGKDLETPEKIENKITDISDNIIDMHSQRKENTIHMQNDKQEKNTSREEGEISNDSISESEMETGNEESTSGFKVNSPTHASSNSKFKLQRAKRHSFSPRSKNFLRTSQQRFRSPVKKNFGRYSLPEFSNRRLQFLNVKKKRLKSNARGFEEDNRNGKSHQEENEKNTSSNVIAPCDSVKKKGELCKDVSSNKDIVNEECHKSVNVASFYKSSTTTKDSVQHNREKSKDEKYDGDRSRRDEKCWKSQNKNIPDNDSRGNTTNTLFKQGNHTDFIDAGNKAIQNSVNETQTIYKHKEYSEEVRSDTSSLEESESPKKRNITKIMQPRMESSRENEAEKEENVRSASKKITEKCNSPVPFGHEAKRKSADKRKINANLINTDKVLKNVADFTCTKKEENRENGIKDIIPSSDSTNKLQKEMNESSVATSNCETNIKIKIQDNNDEKAVEVKPTDKSLEINMKAKSNLSCSTSGETVTKHIEHNIFNVSSPVSDMSNCHRLSQCTSKEICDGTPISNTIKLHFSFEDKRISQGSFSATTSDNSFSDTSPVCVSRHRIKRRSRTCKLGDSSVVSINISPRTLENSDKVGTVRDVSVDSTEIKNMNTKLESTMHCNKTDESRFKPSVSSENSGSLENKRKKDSSYKCVSSSVNIVKNNRSTNSNSNTDTSTKPTTINTRKSNYKTSLDFRKKYASVFAHYSQESDTSSNEDEFVSSSSSYELDHSSDETWRPPAKRKKKSSK